MVEVTVQREMRSVERGEKSVERIDSLHASPPTPCASLLIVIVNYRTPQLTIDCLRSLREEVAALGDAHATVTDNASGDDSADRIADAIAQNDWLSWVTFMPLDRNGGFAFGNNAALRPALASAHPPRYVLLLNPDTYIRPGALMALLRFMDAHPEVGIAGSRIENPDASVRRTAFRFHSVAGEFASASKMGLVQNVLHRWMVAPPPRDEAHPTDWVSGASMIVRREVFDQIGLLDDAYFMYYEEMDFCLRARRAGWPCWYVPDSRVVHLVGQASGVTGAERHRKRMPRYWFESRRRFFLKMHGRGYKLLADLSWIAGFTLWRIRRLLTGKPDNDPPHMLWDFVRFNLGKW